MKIVNINPISLIDFPGKIASVIFLEGCSLRCPYCFNYSLLMPEENRIYITEDEMFEALDENSRMIDGVVFTGGEPTINEDLPEILKELYGDGYIIKLDTNGTRPNMIDRCLPYVDYIAMDVKTDKNGYAAMGASNLDIQNIKKSIKKLIKGRCDYEFRITAIHPFINDDNVNNIGRMIMGAKKVFLQHGRLESVLDPSVEMSAYNDDKLEEYARVLRKYVNSVEIR